MKLGQTIQEIRKQNNLTQEKFAEIFHVTRQTVSNWENEKSYPDLLTLVKISDVFNISLDQMLKEDLKMTKKFNMEIKFAKHIKFILLAVVCIIAISSVIWFFIWNNCKEEVMGKFTKGLEQYEYSIDETASKGGYYIIHYNDDAYFAIPHQSMPDYLDFSTDLHAKTVSCYTQLDGKEVCLIWSGYDNDKNIVLGLVEKDVDGIFSIEKNTNEINNSKDLKEIIDYGTTLYDSLYKK